MRGGIAVTRDGPSHRRQPAPHSKNKNTNFFFVCSPLSLSAKLRGDGELGRASVNVIRRAKRPVTNQRAAGAYTERREENIPEERVPSLYG